MTVVESVSVKNDHPDPSLILQQLGEVGLEMLRSYMAAGVAFLV